MQGLRTLAIATRELDEQWVSEWDARYQEAAALLEGRDEATEKMIEEVERDLDLVGVSAIEDKLQDGVPAAIQTLLDAGIKVAYSSGTVQCPAETQANPFNTVAAEREVIGTHRVEKPAWHACTAYVKKL